jgi:hypothetical protein
MDAVGRAMNGIRRFDPPGVSSSAVMARHFFTLGQKRQTLYWRQMLFWRRKKTDPRVPVLQDIRSVWTDEQPYRWRFVFASIGLTGLMLVGIFHDFTFWPAYKAPEIEWVTSYSKDRSEADVLADQAKFTEEARVEKEADDKRREESKAAYRRLAKGFGMKVVNEK